jgi:hypothetical protein
MRVIKTALMMTAVFVAGCNDENPTTASTQHPPVISPAMMQKQMRHADIRTTLRVYAHVIPQSQRDAMENISIGTVPLAEQKQAATV